MMPVFDFTGIVEFDGLTTNQNYDYQIGYVFAAGEPGDLLAGSNYNWDIAASGSFRTAPVDSTDSMSFVFGSCRYLLRLFGGTFFDRRGDKTFRSINRQVDAGQSTDFLLMIGDQIYADDLAIISPDDKVDEFLSRYRKVFGQEHIRELMGRLPTYMTLDDHEISNDWSQDRFKQESDLFAAAIHAFQCYQLVHGPGFQFSNRAKRSDTPHRLWYRFRHGKSAFFVMDTRTERFPSYSPPQMISPEQMTALKNWLVAEGQESNYKFVVTSVPFFPDTHAGSEDKWSGFTDQRLEILDHIREKCVSKVVFLSGDVHCSMAGQLKCSADPNFLVTSIISSSFFWPYPQGQASGFKLRGRLAKSSDTDYTLSRFGKVYSEDNFTRLSTGGGELKVATYERKGAHLGTRTLTL
ncbi:MAG: alkaline phosphatase D family protein [Alphaproteobacteria bacterium]|nr:alkaline phosphatase D family protein [Alphaproteobacteria bacterium]